MRARVYLRESLRGAKDISDGRDALKDITLLIGNRARARVGRVSLACVCVCVIESKVSFRFAKAKKVKYIYVMESSTPLRWRVYIHTPVFLICQVHPVPHALNYLPLVSDAELMR